MSRLQDPPSQQNRSIGIFDSGIGGLTVLRELSQLLPHENFLYLGDTRHMPYGNLPPEMILSHTLEGASFLFKKGIKLLVVACHTASSHALEKLQKESSIPVIGVIQPAFESLMQTTKTGRVAILATEATIRSRLYQNLILQYRPNSVIFPISCPLLAPLIEEGLMTHPKTEKIIAHYLAPLQTASIDTALLACTHYPLIRPFIQQTLGNQVHLIDPAHSCALQIKEWLYTSSQLNPQKTVSIVHFFSTGNQKKFKQQIHLFSYKRLPKTAFHGII